MHITFKNIYKKLNIKFKKMYQTKQPCINQKVFAYKLSVWRVVIILNQKSLKIYQSNNNNIMIPEVSGIQNYGYLVPRQLSDRNWKKCLQNENSDKKTILEGIVKIRQFLSQPTEVNNLIQNVLDTQVHKPLIKFAKRILERVKSGKATSPQQMTSLHQILWIFTNLCSGSKYTTYKILDLGIINFCKQLFVLQNYSNIISILFELVGNLAGQANSSIKISFLADHNFYNFMKNKYIKYIHLVNFHQNATWAFSNLFRDFDQCFDHASIQVFENVILSYYPIVQELLKVPNQLAKTNLLYVFFYLSKNQVFNMAETMLVIEPYLYDESDKVIQLAVQVIGNYIAQCDDAVDYALKHPKFLSIIFEILKKSSKSKYRKEAAWIVSNIFAGTVNQVQKFVSIPNLFTEFNNILINEHSQSVIKEIVWSIANSYTTCSEKAFEYIFYSSIIEELSLKLLTCTEKTSFTVYAEGIVHYLTKFQKNPNLDFNLFLKNLEFIQSTIKFTTDKYLFDLSIENNCKKAQNLIQLLKKRGPITEQEMMKQYLQKFGF